LRLDKEIDLSSFLLKG